MILDKNQAKRFIRQIALKEIGVYGQKKLLSSKVLVIGAGGLGSPAILYLAAAGVGTIGIADHDKVEISNLQRQIIHSTSFVGRKKVSSAKQSALSLNPDIRIVCHDLFLDTENIMQIISDYDFIMDCTDRFETKFLINDACVLAEKPYSHAGAVGWAGQTMTYVPGKGPCLRCLLNEVPHNGITCSEAGVLGVALGVIGSIQAAEAIKYILEEGELLTGKILSVDVLSMDICVHSVCRSNPDCPVCGRSPTIRFLSDNVDDYMIHSCGREE